MRCRRVLSTVLQLPVCCWPSCRTSQSITAEHLRLQCFPRVPSDTGIMLSSPSPSTASRSQRVWTDASARPSTQVRCTRAFGLNRGSFGHSSDSFSMPERLHTTDSFREQCREVRHSLSDSLVQHLCRRLRTEWLCQLHYVYMSVCSHMRLAWVARLIGLQRGWQCADYDIAILQTMRLLDAGRQTEQCDCLHCAIGDRNRSTSGNG